MEIDVMFKAWSEHAAAMEKGQRKIVSAANPIPLWKNLGVVNTISALTTQSIVLGGPASGRMWYIHRVGILGTDGHTAVAGAIVDVYGGPGQEADASAQLYAGLSIPTIIVEGRFHNPLQFGDRLYILAYNLPANQQVQFVAGVEDYAVPETLAVKVP